MGGGGGEREGVYRQFYPRFNAAPCHAHPGSRTSVRRVNRRPSSLLKGEETAETNETRYLWKRFNNLK